MKSVIIADPIHEQGISILKNNGLEVIDISNDKEKINDYISVTDAIIVRSATKVHADLLDKAEKLKIVGRAGVGLDNIDLDGCKRKNIKVVNSPEGPTRSVAELTLGLIIAVSRHMIENDKETKSGNWPKKQKGKEIFDKTLGIIGSGAIGGTLAKYCIFMGMKVIAYDIVELEELRNLDGFNYVDLDKLFSQADIISLHVPLVRQTHHLVNKDTINKMKDGVIIVNASRGGVIDENALYDGIKEGKVAGAALDVYENEPANKNNPIVSLPQVITTAHIGAQTIEANIRNSRIVCQKIVSFFNE